MHCLRPWIRKKYLADHVPDPLSPNGQPQQNEGLHWCSAPKDGTQPSSHYKRLVRCFQDWGAKDVLLNDYITPPKWSQCQSLKKAAH